MMPSACPKSLIDYYQTNFSNSRVSATGRLCTSLVTRPRPDELRLLLSDGKRKSCSWNRLNTGVAARSTAELFASNSSSPQWFVRNVCRSNTTNFQVIVIICCASLGTNLGSPSIVFIMQYVEVLPCQAENAQKKPHCL